MSNILIIGFGYLLGSFPSGYLAGYWIKGIDLRKTGSGSTGATNVLRHVGKKAALIVFLIDVLKGVTAVAAAKFLLFGDGFQVICGLAAIIGHIWPVWIGFKGGKAVATGLGIFLGLSWQVGLASLGIFLSVFSISKIVSLSSLIASISLPLLMLLSFKENNFQTEYFLISLSAMLIVIWRHRSNIQRLLEGKEHKFSKD